MAKQIKEKKEPLLYKEWLSSVWTVKLIGILDRMSRIPDVRQDNLMQVSTYAIAYLQAVQKIKDEIANLDIPVTEVKQKISHYDAVNILKEQGLWDDKEIDRMIKQMEISDERQ